MSGLAGTLGPPTGPQPGPQPGADAEALLAHLAHRGTTAAVHRVGPAALGLVGPPAGGREAGGPVVDPASGLAVAFDGRLAARADLARQLAGTPVHGGADAHLALAALVRWGWAGAARLLGDFALAAWDPRRHELLLARDPLGKRPLYEHRRDGALRWAAEPQALLRGAALPPPEAEHVADVLSGRRRSNTTTLWSGVRRVDPGTLLVVAADGRRTVLPGWRPRLDDELRLADDRAYVERFREVLDGAIGDCLDDGPAAVELSGGLDSSSVLASVVAVRGAGAASAWSLGFPGHPCDESPFQDAVVRHLGVAHRRTPHRALGPAHYRDQVDRHLDLPDYPNQGMHLANDQAVRAAGHRAVLGGKGADEWLTGTPLALADALRAGRLGEVRGLLAGHRARGARPAVALWRFGVRPLLPVAAQQVLRRGRTAAVPPWVTPGLVAVSGLAEPTAPGGVPGRRRAAASLAQAIDDPWQVHIHEASERARAELGLEQRAPFDDRRLVELALALPERLRQRDGWSKWVLREAMAGRLPDEVRLRPDKAEFSSVFVDELLAVGDELPDGLAVADLGWVDPRALRAALADLRRWRAGGSAPPPDPWALWGVLCVEMWSRRTL